MNKQMVTLGSITVLKGLQTGPFGSQLKAEEYTDRGIPVVMPKDISNGEIITNEIARVSEAKAKKLTKHRIVVGDIIFPRRGNLGRIGVAKKENEGWLCGTGCLRARLKDDVDSNYIHQYVQLASVKRWLESNALGQTMLNLNTEIISKLPISIVPLPEQKAIADLLSTWDEAIEKTERLIAAKEKKLSAYRQQLFNPKRKSQMDGWTIVRFRDVLREHGNLSTGNEEVFSVSVHKGIVNQIEHLGRSFSAKNTLNYNRVHTGDIVYTKSPTGDFPYGIVKQSKVDEDVIVSPLYGVFTPITKEIGTIIEFYFESPVNAKNSLHPIIQKGAKNTINITNITFLLAELNLPLLQDEQKKIAVFVNVSRAEIDLLNELVQKYKEQKRGLTQKLLVGQWRVKTSGEVV